MKKLLIILFSLILCTVTQAVSGAVLSPQTTETGDVIPIKWLGNVELDSINEYSPQEDGLSAFSAPPDWLTQRCNTLYNHLGQLEDGTNIQSLYNKLFDAMSAFTCDYSGKTTYYNSMHFITINLNNLSSLDFQEMQDAYYAVIQDNPQFFYIGQNIASFTVNGERYFAVQLANEYVTADNRLAEVDAITSGIEGYDKIINKNMSAYSIEKNIHDKLIRDNNYAYDSEGNPSNETFAHSIAGSLNSTYGGGVCESYSKTFKLLLNRYLVPSYYVAGLANGGGHAWNYIQLDDGNYYCVDSTWDDVRINTSDGIVNGLYYKYFNQPFTDFYSYRSADENYMRFTDALPVCSDSTAYYSSSPTSITLVNGEYIGVAPDVSEDETRLVTETTTETTTKAVSLPPATEASTESTTCNLQIIAQSSKMPVTVVKGNATLSSLSVSGTIYSCAKSVSDGTVISVSAKKPTVVNFCAYMITPGDTLRIYVDDILYEEYTDTGYVYNYSVSIPSGNRRISWVFNRQSSTGTLYLYNLNAVCLGDYNSDNSLDLTDVVGIMNTEYIDSTGLIYNDINSDGIVNSTDIALILKYIAGIA